jgi:hypothetical protein
MEALWKSVQYAKQPQEQFMAVLQRKPHVCQSMAIHIIIITA